MKKLLFILFCFINIIVYGTTYYVKTGGNDEAAGTSDGTAWATITKVNTVWAAGTFAPGDNILFNRGDTFYGALVISEAGAVSNHITVGAYGTGERPIITGLETIDTWTDYGGGIYYHVLDEAPTTDLEMILVDGVQTNMGRWPSYGGWARWEAKTNTTYIVDTDLDDTDWTGAELFLIKNLGLSKICTITEQSGDTLYWTPNDGYSYGTLTDTRYFIQEHFATLDSLHEWYYDKEDTLFMYFGTETPGDYTVQAAVLTQLVSHSATYKSYITFDGLHFKGANRYGVYAYYDNYWYIKNCTIDYIGDRGIYIRASDNCRVDSCNINYVNDIGIHSTSDSDNTVINADTIQNIGLFLGHGVNAIYGAASIMQGSQQTIQYNYIHKIGRKGIAVSPEGATVQYNLIDSTEYHLRDGGAIYVGVGNLAKYDTVTIADNIIRYGLGGQNANEAFGIYVDLGMIYGVEILRNTVAYQSGAGLKLSNAQNVNIHDNLFYDLGFKIQEGSVLPGESATALSNIDMSRNYFMSRNSTSIVGYFKTLTEHHDDIGDIDSNYYARPVSDNDIIELYVTSLGGNLGYYTLSEWQTFSSLDAHSLGSPVGVSDTSKIKFYYNPTREDSTFTLTDNLLTMDGDKFTGDTVISAYGSAIFLIDPDPVVDPPDIPTVVTTSATFVFPESITLAGNVTDDGDGTVVSKGLVYGLTSSPEIADGDTVNGGAGTGSFTATVTGLLRGRNYYARAYAVNEVDTVYGYEHTVRIPKFVRLKSGGKWIKDSEKYVTSDSKQNLLLYSEQLDNAAWGKYNLTATAGAVPDVAGNATMDTIKQTGNYSNLQQDVTVVPGLDYVFSFDAQRGEALETAIMYYRVLNNISGYNIVSHTNYYSKTNASSPVRITVPFTTPSGCTSVKLYIVVLSTGSSGSFYAGRAQLAYPGMNYIVTTSTNVE